jgi:protein-tyrosine sulfotransferase
MNVQGSRSQVASAFILSDARSGSTLLRYMLDTHPEICCPGELYLGELCKNLCWTLSFTTGVLSTTSRSEKEQIVVDRARKIVSEIMHTYVQAKKKRIWCEKSPPNIQYLSTLHRLFPDARYICLYRNCLDVVYSLLETNRLGWWPELVPYVVSNPDNLVAAMIENWRDRATRLLAFENENPSVCFRIKFEDLVTQPEKVVGPLLRFLEVRSDSDLPDRVFLSRHDEGVGDIKAQTSNRIRKDAVGKGSAISLSLIPPHLLEEMNALLSQLEYPIVGPDWDSISSPYIPADADASRPVHDCRAVAGVRQIVEEYFPRRLKERNKLMGEVKGRCKLLVTGEESGTWMIDTTGPQWRIDADDSDADCTVLVSDGDLIDMVNGRLNPGEAFERGRLRVRDDLRTPNEMGRILFGA